MSKRHGLTARIIRSQEGPINRITHKKNNPVNTLPGEPSCKRVKGILVFYSSGVSPMESYKRNMQEIEKIFNSPSTLHKKKGRRKW